MKKLLSYAGILSISILLAACGGGGGAAPAADDPGAGGGASAPETATLGIVITDNHDERYDEAIATITGIELLCDDGKQTVFSDTMVVDLFKLRDFVELVNIADDIQPDTCDKIRLHLSSLVLIKRDDDGNIEEQVDAHLAGNGKMDLKPDGDIVIAPGAVLFVTLDFDVDKSLKITETGNGKVIVRPVIFVRVGTVPGFKEGITRVSGEITRINEAPDAFLLCMVDLMATPSGSTNPDVAERCVKTAIKDDTGVFGSDGLPIRPSALAIGDLVTVVGTLALPDDDPVIQPVPSSASDADSDSNADSDSDSDSDSDGGGSRPPLQFVLNAIVIEVGAPGTFASIRGQLESEINEDAQYQFLVSSQQGFAPDTMLLGQLYPTSRIINPKGVDVDPSTLGAGDGALVDGIVVLTDAEGENDTLRTALMLVRGEGTTPPELEEEVLVGKVLGVDERAQEVTIATDKGDRCVLADDAAVLFFVEDTEGNVEIVEGKITDLQDGAIVVNFGVEDVGGCFDADTIISRAAPKKPDTTDST